MIGPSSKSILPAGLPPWRAVLFDGHSIGFAETADHLFRVGIEPACLAIAQELEATPRGHTDEQIDSWEDKRTAQLELHRSFALALGGLFERNFSLHLWHSTATLRPGDDEILATIHKGNWNGLQEAFLKVRHFPLTQFPSFNDLDLLHRVSSAARHGDGRTLSGLYRSHPEMFLEHDVTSGWFSYFTLGGEPGDTIRKLEVTLDHLRRFRDAIIDFWLSIRELQASDKA